MNQNTTFMNQDTTLGMLWDVSALCSHFQTDAHVAVVDGKKLIPSTVDPHLENLLPTAELRIGAPDVMRQGDTSEVLRRTMAQFHAKIGFLLGPKAERTSFNFLLEKDSPWLYDIAPEDREIAERMGPTLLPFNEVNQSCLSVLTSTTWDRRASIAVHFWKQEEELLARWNDIMERYKARFK